MSNNQITYHNFIMMLDDLHSALASVLIFFTCNSNRAGRITFSEGDIIAIRYANKKGTEALASMENIDHVKTKQQKLNVLLPKDDGLPATNIIIQKLLAFSKEVGVESIPNLEKTTTHVTENTTLETEHTTEQKTDSLPFSEAQKKDIETNLIKIIGPMGAFLCQKHVHNATDMNQAMSGIATEISADELGTLRKMLSFVG